MTKAVFPRKPTFNPCTLNKIDHYFNYLLTRRRIFKSTRDLKKLDLTKNEVLGTNPHNVLQNYIET